MLGASNDFYNFVLDNFDYFETSDGVTLKAAWERYKLYCDDAKVSYPFSLKTFKEELRNYFADFKERMITQDGVRVRSFYSGFLADKFRYDFSEVKESEEAGWIRFKEQHSIFDELYSYLPAQYAKEDGTPEKSWDNVKTKLEDLNTHVLHYVLVPEAKEKIICIDFDKKDKNGNKSLEKNLAAANLWPKTYAELSKSGSAIHLYYIYDGDVSDLDNLYEKDVEVKVFNGKSSLRRRLTKCTDDEISHISAGLPKKEKKKNVVDVVQIKNEKDLRRRIEKNLRKEIMGYTKPSMDFIAKILDDAYESKISYDVNDLYPDLMAFAASSTHNSDYCLKLLKKLKLKSEDHEQIVESKEKVNPIVFFDCEVFPN